MRFLINSLKRFGTVWAIARVSKHAGAYLVSQTDCSQPQTIVERWAWPGNITRQLIEEIHPESSLHAYEIHEWFLAQLTQLSNPRLTIHSTCASSVVEDLGLNAVDHIISTLPFTLLPKHLTTKILLAGQSTLKPWGQLHILQYSQTMKHTFIETLFELHLTKTRLIWRNLPPAHIFTFTK